MIEGIPCTYGDGEVIFAQDDPAADLYVITKGEVRITRAHCGTTTALATLGAGDFFGEMGLFAPGPRTASAVAIGAVECEVIDVTTFKSAVPEPVVWRMLSRLSSRVREAYDTMDAAESKDREPLT